MYIRHTSAERNMRVNIFKTSKGRASLFSLMMASTLVLPAGLYAASAGTSAGDLLKVPVSARAIGMGEAYTGLADDSNALDWNPAGLSFLQQKEAAFMHSSLMESIHYERAAFASPGERISYGAAVSYLGFGSIDGYDNAGNSIGNQSAYSYNLTGGLASLLMPRLSVGLTGSYLKEKLADESASTFAMNAGALYEFAARPFGAAYRLGFSALNLGPGLKFVSERDPLPRKYNVGVSAQHIKEIPLNLTADFSIPNDNKKSFKMGAEYWMKELFALRLGYAGSTDDGSGLRFGFGIKLRELLLDYAFSDQGDLGAAHRVEVMVRWGTKSHPLNREQRAILKEAKRAKEGSDHIQQILALNDLLNTDPENDVVLKKMIDAHEDMLRTELNEAVAQLPAPEEEVPSPEEFALQDLVPGQQSVAQSQAAASYDPMDPLGLNNLPDVSELEALAPSPDASPAVVPAPSAPAAVEAPNVMPEPQAAPSEPAVIQKAPIPQAVPSPEAAAAAEFAPASEPAAVVPSAPAAAAPESDGILLKPSDIYGE